MKAFLIFLKKNFDVIAVGGVFFIIGILELLKPNIRPTGRWHLIGGFLWDRFGNLGVSFIIWALGVIVVVGFLKNKGKK